MLEQEGFCLTMPSDSARSTRWITGRFLKKLARDLFSLPAELYGDDLSSVRETLFNRLRSLGKDGVLSIVRRPQVHSFLCCATSSLIGRNVPGARARSRELLFQLAFEMSLDGTLNEDVLWDAPFPLENLVSPTHRKSLSWDSSVDSLRFKCSDIVSSGGALGWVDSNFPALGERFVLALADSNPMSDFEAHPDKGGNQLSLGSSPVDGWTDSLSASLSVIADSLPGIFREMSLIHQQFIPVGTDDERHLSASYQESIGTI